MTIDSILNSTDIKSPEVRPESRKPSFFNKAKLAVLVPVIALTIACGYKKIYDGNNTQIYVNKDGSQVKIELKNEEFIYKGPSLESLWALSTQNLELIKYTRKNTQPFKPNEAYSNKKNVVDKAQLQLKSPKGKRILLENQEYMKAYLRR